MSRDLGRDIPDLEELYARKLWADFPFPTGCHRPADVLAIDSAQEGVLHDCSIREQDGYE